MKSKITRWIRSITPRAVVALLCVLVLIAGGLYTVGWYLNRERILNESAEYSSLYTPATPAPTMAPPPQSSEPSPTPRVSPTPDPMPTVSDKPIPTPDGDTVVYALETPPPVQDSFRELLRANPETVGFLQIGDIVSLPVVQRKYDNEYYLNHTFSGITSSEGTLFLDGYNQLVPEDDCLIIYGHNMHNGTMFGNLRSYLNLDYFRSSGIVTFDSIYHNRSYVPFAAFNASMQPGDSNYVDIRRYLFSESEFDGFVSLLQAYSEHSVPVDVQYGDQLLLLVTCDYSNDDGRFILALRELREGENLVSVSSLLNQAR